MSQKISESITKTLNEIKKVIPTLASVLLLLGLVKVYLTEQILSKVFIGNPITDPLLGGLIGSISAGNPITSYVIGGELLNQGVSLFAVTAFIVTWVTVGTIQFPMEAETLGHDFAIKRNITSFFLALLVSGSTVLILNLLGTIQ